MTYNFCSDDAKTSTFIFGTFSGERGKGLSKRTVCTLWKIMITVRDPLLTFYVYNMQKT